MRRVEPTPAVALPPVTPLETNYDTNGDMGGSWKMTERKRPVGYNQSPRRSSRRASSKRTARGAPCPRGEAENGTTPRGEQATGTPQEGLPAGDVEQSPGKPDGPPKPQKNAVKVRSIEGWLNSTLDEKDAEEDENEKFAQSVTGGSQRMQGLSQYGIDAAALERLGLDPKATERVHRALFVYSQGLHTVLQDAVGTSHNRSQALLVLWKAFTAVLENAAQNDKSGEASLAALVQQGNAEEMARIEGEYKDKLLAHETEVSRLNVERREKQQEINRLKEDEMRLRNENDMYQNDHEIAMQKYELEIRQRMNAEVRYLEKVRWAQALQDDLNKEKTQSMHLTKELSEANTANEALLVEMDDLKTQLRTFEAENQEHQQQSLEAAQQKQRYEHQFAQLKQNLERSIAKQQEMQEQLAAEAESNKALNEQITGSARDFRKIETQLEDESHFRQELQSERDVLRRRLDALDKEMGEMIEERRQNQKEISDLRMKQRTDEIELKRLREQVTELDKKCKKQEDAHEALVDNHRTLGVECDYLREDVRNLDEQLKKETDLRKSLQLDKKQLHGQLQTMTIEKDTAQLAVSSTRKELTEVTKKMVKMESVVRQTQSAMSKLELEHSVERKAHSKKVALLEKVISDEREERRNLVKETQEMGERREDTMERLARKEVEIEELKRQRLEQEEEADRCKIMLRAQEQRCEELLVMVDKQHSAVANHDAEMRQMHTLLENERQEATRQIEELQSAYAVGRHTMEQRIDMWQMRFEDALSLLHFNPATQKIQTLQSYVKELEKELKELKLQLEAAQEAVRKREEEVQERSERIMQLQAQVKDFKSKHSNAETRLAEIFEAFNARSMVMTDAQQQNARLKEIMETFDAERESLEDRIEQLLRKNQTLTSQLNKTKATVSVQAQPKIKNNSQQTDLSYQYLESVDGMQRGPRRHEQLNKLKSAGDFVDDVEHGRDFTVKCKPNKTGTGDLRIEPTADRRASLVHMNQDEKPRPPSLGKPSSNQSARQSTTAGTMRPNTRGSPGFGPSPPMGAGATSRPIGLTPSPWPPNSPR